MDPRRLLPALTALACACVVATLVVALARPADRAPREAPMSVPAAADVDDTAPLGPGQILAAWDRRRAAAWAEGDVEALRALYASGSRAGEADAGLLQHYLRRGLTVEGLRTQVLALTVTDRSRRRLVLRVTDRVVGARAVGGPTPIELPADRATTRRIELVRSGRSSERAAGDRGQGDRGQGDRGQGDRGQGDQGQGDQGQGEWLVAEVWGQASPAASTSVTSSSSKS